MAANRWSIRNYNAALREIRAHTGGTLAEARQTWARLRVEAGKPLRGTDVRRMERTEVRKTQREAKRIAEPGHRRTRREQREAAGVQTLADWYRMLDQYDEEDLEDLDYEASDDDRIDYGTTKR